MQLCFFVLFLNGVMLWKGIVVNLRPSLLALFWKRIASLFALNLGLSPRGRRMCRPRRDRMRGNPLVFYALTLLRICNRSQIVIFRSKIQI